MELDALLRACVLAPDDVGQRLILADWFDDRGRPEAGPLRLPGYWWLVPDETRVQVASVVFWRAPEAERVLSRLGSVADFRVSCQVHGLSWPHLAARTWTNRVSGWACGWHAGVICGRDLRHTGAAVLSAEGTYIGNRSARGRFKKRLTEARR